MALGFQSQQFNTPQTGMGLAQSSLQQANQIRDQLTQIGVQRLEQYKQEEKERKKLAQSVKPLTSSPMWQQNFGGADPKEMSLSQLRGVVESVGLQTTLQQQKMNQMQLAQQQAQAAAAQRQAQDESRIRYRLNQIKYEPKTETGKALFDATGDRFAAFNADRGLLSEAEEERLKSQARDVDSEKYEDYTPRTPEGQAAFAAGVPNEDVFQLDNKIIELQAEYMAKEESFDPKDASPVYTPSGQLMGHMVKTSAASGQFIPAQGDGKQDLELGEVITMPNGSQVYFNGNTLQPVPNPQSSITPRNAPKELWDYYEQTRNARGEIKEKFFGVGGDVDLDPNMERQLIEFNFVPSEKSAYQIEQNQEESENKEEEDNNQGSGAMSRIRSLAE